MTRWKEVYQVIITHNNKQVELLGTYQTEESANKLFNNILQENRLIDFPVQFVSSKYIEEARYEVVIIRKRVNENIPLTTKLRNAHGEFVNHQTNNENWVIHNKGEYLKEETFWVYGYHPLVQRKTFKEIVDNIIRPLTDKRKNGTNIIVYNNKIILDSLEKVELIICKNMTDAIRFYNLIENDKRKYKIKFINFCGNWSYSKIGKEKCIKKIQQLTNWDKAKIRRKSTKP